MMSQTNCSSQYDIFMVGVGGQGMLTIGDLVVAASMARGIPANFYPTKGMAQRGGFVKAQLRLGRTTVGPQIPERGADLIIAAELSEALKAIRYVAPGGEFLLFGHIWQPTAVMLGKAPYPQVAQVMAQTAAAGAQLRYVDPAGVPQDESGALPDNIYILGAAMGHTALGKLLDPSDMRRLVQTRWRRGAERNVAAYDAGLAAAIVTTPTA